MRILLILCTVLISACVETTGDDVVIVDTAAIDTVAATPRLKALLAGYPPTVLGLLAVDTTGAAAWVDSVAAAMTLRQQVGQLVIADYGPATTKEIADFGIGGVLMPRTMDPEDLRREVVAMQEASALPLFVTADFERGAGRFNNALTELPSNMTIAATGDTSFAAAAGRVTAIESRAVGVNLVFAPVVDVNRERLNPIINIRSYGDNATEVAEYAISFSAEAERLGLLTTFKHFPGHGNSSTDSHSSLAVVRGTIPEIEEHDLVPYEHAVASGRAPSAVMVGHLWVPAIDEDPLAATFSEALVSGYLRQEIGYDGVVFSDDIRMQAVSSDHTLEERVVRSLRAGVDVIVTPNDVEDAVAAVESAVALGTLERSRVEEAVRRVLRAKAAAGLHNQRVTTGAIYDFLEQHRVGQSVADTIARASITRYAGADSMRWPARLSVVHLANFPESESILAAMDSVDAWLDVETSIRSSTDMTRDGREVLTEDVEEAETDAVLVILYQRLRAGRGSAGLLEGHRLYVRDLLRLEKPVHILNVGNPYEVPDFPDATSILVGYDQTIATLRAAVAVGRDGAQARGRPPVHLER